jgi:hypothetical protein
MAQTETDGPPRAVFIAALAVAVVTIAVILGIAATRKPAETPVAITSVPAPQASSPSCKALLGAVPDRLGDYRRAATVDPTPEGTAAWRTAPGTEPVILRCGLERPDDFVVGAPQQLVDEVAWFQVSDPGSGLTTWFAVDRAVYVALTLPDGSGPTPIQDISQAIAGALPAQPVNPGPAR